MFNKNKRIAKSSNYSNLFCNLMNFYYQKDFIKTFKMAIIIGLEISILIEN